MIPRRQRHAIALAAALRVDVVHVLPEAGLAGLHRSSRVIADDARRVARVGRDHGRHRVKVGRRPVPSVAMYTPNLLSPERGTAAGHAGGGLDIDAMIGDTPTKSKSSLSRRSDDALDIASSAFLIGRPPAPWPGLPALTERGDAPRRLFLFLIFATGTEGGRDLRRCFPDTSQSTASHMLSPGSRPGRAVPHVARSPEREAQARMFGNGLCTRPVELFDPMAGEP